MHAALNPADPEAPRVPTGGSLVLHVLLTILTVLPFALTPGRAAADPAQRYSLRGDHVAVYDLAGSLAVVAGSGSETVVEVTPGGGDAARLRIATGEIRDERTLRVVFPSNHVVYPQLGRGQRTTLHVRSDGTFGDKHGGEWFDTPSVTISGSGDGLEAHADLRVFVPEGQQIDVHLATGIVHVTNVDAKLSVDVAAADVTTTRTKGSLAVDAGSGDVQVHDATGPVAIDTGSGDVEVTGARGGDIAIDTGSGGVQARDLDSDRIAVDTGSGEVTLGTTRTRRLAVDTGSGGVDIDLLSDVDELSVDTGSGGAKLRVPQDLGATLALQTGSGDFDVDLPMSHVHRDEGELNAVVGDGRGKVVIETGSGGITIHGR
jgi:lia operon protein LiaG